MKQEQEGDAPVVRRKHRRLSRRARMRIGCALIAAGAIAIAGSVVWVVPDYLMSAGVNPLGAVEERLDEEVEAPSDEAAEEAVGTSVVTETERSSHDIDFASLQSMNLQVRSWISVPNKGIDFPVCQGSDNEYYLHHDMYGRWGYGGVFVDHRADPNGRNVIVYGHTLIGGGMFTKLGTADEPGQLATVGPVYYTTPEAGTVEFTPIATMHVYPTFQDVQQFSWDVSDEQLEAARRAIAEERADAGDWSVELPEGERPEGDYLVDWYPVEDGVVHDGEEGDVAVTRYYTTSAVFNADAQARAEKGAWRDWLVSLCEQSTQVSSDVAERIATADRSLVLACCSWPFDSHRTLVICVAS